MAKRIGLLVQAVFTFFIGLLLASQGLPSSEEEAALYTGNTVMDALNETTDDPVVAETTANFKSSFLMLGSAISLVSVLEFLGVLISFFK